ncbi:hypothetical protein H4R20_002379 [Coemansia guatemalensis]|uniref:Uncharacterized protein n=1 Tax=Coemansia guatemalensis TaxID=2761395 RepID=A0A9W8HV95_9FUNG|nr:hypothetical protein H4R20_002379 [Coemansia guatemalensis]
MNYKYPDEIPYYGGAQETPYSFMADGHLMSSVGYPSQIVQPLGVDPLQGLPMTLPQHSQQPHQQQYKGKRSNKAKITKRPHARGPTRPKTPWSTQENRNLFRVMAEYIYIDKDGLKPLAIYLNPSELDHVEQCELSLNMTDSDIIQSLCEQEIETNPNRGSHLLFGVLRHMQSVSGDHSVRVVNEKVKNIRSRIVNWFMTMFADGTLPTKRPVRYVTAILNSLVSSPFCPAKDTTATIGMGLYAAADSKHDVCLWLQAMFWLYPRKMYEFVLQCAVQIVRARIQNIPYEHRTNEEVHVLTVDYPDIYVLIEQLRRLINFLNDDNAAKEGKGVGCYRGTNSSVHGGFDPDYESDGLGKKRKRRPTPKEAKRKAPANNAKVPTNDGEEVSLALFDLLKNQEKLRIAGMRVKMIAAVGGVVRNGSSYTSMDIKYHLYRLWTCVARLSKVSQMLVPAQHIPAEEASNWPSFAEFVVVQDYYSPFDIASVEPRIRGSKNRVNCNEGYHKLEEIVEQWVASTEGESRVEIPIWLAIARRMDGKYVLSLIISSLHTVIPSSVVASTPMSLSVLGFRKFSDGELAPLVDNAIPRGGNIDLDGTDMCNHGGLDPWPWNSSHASNISMSHGYTTQIKVDVSGSSVPLIISSAYSNNPNVIDPWMEPRIMASAVFHRQKAYAESGIVGSTPSFEEILEVEQRNENNLDLESRAVDGEGANNGVNTDVSSTVNTSANVRLSWQPQNHIPGIPLDSSSISGLPSDISTFAPSALATSIHKPDRAADHSVIDAYSNNAAAYDSALYGDGMPTALQPILETEGGLLMDGTQQFPIDIINSYNENGWNASNFDPNSTYAYPFDGSAAPSEYGPP